MRLTRRHAALILAGAGALLVARPFLGQLGAAPSRADSAVRAGQDQAPNRPEFTLVARDFRYSPDRIDVTEGDLVKVTIRSDDIAYSFAVDEYRIVRRVPPGGSTTFEFMADRAGTFRFYSNLTTDPAHSSMQGRLVVRTK